MKYEIKNRWTGSVTFTAEIECDENASVKLKVGLAVKWAISHNADLTGADLTGADLTGANLTGADLTRANLTLANLTRANLTRADLTRANLTVPTVDHLDAKILAAIENGGRLKMDAWHTCDTTHCRAGWTCVLAGYAGDVLESKIGTECAARLIYLKSRPGQPHPDFFASNEDALFDIKKCASENPLPK